MGVTGIGGVILRSRDPAVRAAWYAKHLGIPADGASVWHQQAGPTVVAALGDGDGEFSADQPWMLNLRVEGLDAMVARLEAAGIAIERHAEWDAAGFGRFARLQDPEGLPIELWEPEP